MQTKYTLERLLPKALEMASQIGASKITPPESVINQSDPEVRSYNEARREAKETAQSLVHEVFNRLIKEAGE